MGLASNLFETARRGLVPLALCALAGCSLITDTAVRGGLGKSCSRAEDCAGSLCQHGTVLTEPESGICSLMCKTDADCLDGTSCTAGWCQVPMKVGLSIPESPAPADAWSLTFTEGINKAAAGLGYVRIDRSFMSSGSSVDALRGLAEKNSVVVGHQIELLPSLAIVGTEKPAATFLGVNGGNTYILPDNPPNLGQAWPRTEEAWFIAGRLAAKSAAKRLGMISGIISPESVRNTNAFALGARSEKPSIVIEVRHIGYTLDTSAAPTYSFMGQTYYREEYLARLLWEAGAEVVADMSHRNERARRVLQPLDAMRPVLSIISSVPYGSGDLDPNIEKSVLAAVFINWAPIYTRLFEQIHRGQLAASASLAVDIAEGDGAPLGVLVNRNARSGLDRDDDAVFFTRELANSREPARQRIFTGPFKSNGQRDVDDNGLPDPTQEVAASGSLADEELARMCFYVEGIVEKRTLNDPLSPDQPALVPGGLVPGSTSPNSAVELTPAVDKLALPAGQSANCRKNARWVYRSSG